MSTTCSRLPFETTHLRDHRNLPSLLVPRAPNDRGFIDTCSLSTSSCNGLCDRRIRPGHRDSRAQYNRVFIECRALAIPVSNKLEELSPFRIFQEAIVPRLQDWEIVPGPDINRSQCVDSFPLSGSVVSSSNTHSDLLLDSNARPRPVLMIAPLRSSTLQP